VRCIESPELNVSSGLRHDSPFHHAGKVMYRVKVKILLYSTLLEVAYFKSQEMEREFCGW